jgi:NTE family protein
MFVGTSAGAINAALLASVAHLEARQARDEILARWATIDKSRVLGPVLPSLARALATYAGALVLGIDSPSSLLDTEPLLRSLSDKQLIDWKQIGENIKSGAVQTLAVVATEGGSGRSKVFFEEKAADPKNGSHNNVHSAALHMGPPRDSAGVRSDLNQAIDYVPSELGPEHVRASAAIPVLFPPVLLKHGPRESLFVDGGVRLNAPLKPALALGAKALVVVSTDPRRYGTSAAVDGIKKLPMQDQVLEAFRAIFADRMIEDLRVLEDRNRIALRRGPGSNGHDGNRAEDSYIPLIFGGPQDQTRVGSVALRAIRQILRGPLLAQLWNKPELLLLNWLTSVSSASGPDLLSYILFEPEFIDEALKAGIQDAKALLNDYPDSDALWGALRSRDARKELAVRESMCTGDDAHPS